MSIYKGQKLVLPDRCFPRYQFFKNHLRSIVERLGNIVEHGDLSELTFNGTERLKDIKLRLKDFSDDVEISLFDKQFKWTLEHVAVRSTYPPVRKTQIDLAEFLRETENISVFPCHFAVVVIDQEQQFQELTRRLQGRSENQLNNVILYHKKNDKTYLYTDVLERKVFPPSDDLARGKLSHLLQFLMEIKLINFLDHLRSFIHPFVPTQKNAWENNTPDFTHHSLAKQYINGYERLRFTDMPVMTRDRFREILYDHITRMSTSLLCVHLARQNNIPTCLMHGILIKIQLENETSRICDEFADDTTDLRDVKKNLLPVCEETLMKANSEVQKFMPLLKLMMRLELEVKGLMRESKVLPSYVKTPRLPEELCLELQNIEDIKSFGHKFGKLAITLEKEQKLTEKTLASIKKVLKKHNYALPFSIDSLITNCTQANASSKIEHGNQIRLKSRTPKEGTKYEEFIASLGGFVNLKDKLSCSTEDMENSAAEKKKNGSNDAHTSSLCDKTNDEIETNSPSSLFAVTCAHCVRECQQTVEVARTIGNFESFGEVVANLVLDDDDCKNLDLACIRIFPDKTCHCNLKVRKPQDFEPSSDWQVYSDIPVNVGTSVYIIGGITRLSEGLVIEADRITSTPISELGLIQSYTLLIEPKADFPGFNGTLPFSEKGDSGSIVWYHTSDDNLYALGLLCGALTDSSGQYSYASYTKTLFDFFSERNELRIEPACCSEIVTIENAESDPSSESNELEGAVGGENL